MKNNTIYISGPMTGMKDYNKKAFDKAEKYLSNRGFNVINPYYLNPPDDYSPDQYFNVLENDIKALEECEYIYMLEGWEKSFGAKIEHLIAKYKNIQILYENNYNYNMENIENIENLEQKLERVEKQLKELISYIDSYMIPEIKNFVNSRIQDESTCNECENCNCHSIRYSNPCIVCGDDNECNCQELNMVLSKQAIHNLNEAFEGIDDVIPSGRQYSEEEKITLMLNFLLEKCDLSDVY